jgi:hypothetical protein
VNNGWKNIGSTCCGPAGSIVIYDTTSKGMDHAAFSMGGGLISQHNPYRCRFVPTPPSSLPFVCLCRVFHLECRFHLSRVKLSRFCAAAPAARGAPAVFTAKAADASCHAPSLPFCNIQ